MPATNTPDTAITSIITTAIEMAIRSALMAAKDDGERVMAYRVVQHDAGHLAVWLDLDAGKMARFGVWDGSASVASLTINRGRKTRTKLRSVRVNAPASVLQDWTEVV